MDRLLKLWDGAKSPWTLLALAVLAVAFLAWRLQAGREEIAGLRRDRDEAALRAANADLRAKGAAELLVAAQEQASALEKRVQAFPAELQAAVAAARKASPGARIVGVVRAETRPAPATDGGQSPNLAASQGPGAKPESPPGAGPRCLLREGDLGMASVEAVQIETEAGAVAVTGESWCWRTSPPRARLFGGPWSVDMSSAAVAPPSAAVGGPGWGAGALAVAGSGGVVAGVALAPPPLSLGPLAVEPTAGAAANARGDWAVLVSVILRSRP